MLNRTMIEILKKAAAGALPTNVDANTPGINLLEFKALQRGGAIEAIDASTDDGDCYLEPKITLDGLKLLADDVHESVPARHVGTPTSPPATEPWWSSFDRRLAVAALVVAILGLASSAGLLVVK
ncbi:MAG: hypothetical protein U5L74_00010 [Ideonella sp.]|nr:hypothetical protein [Ideonella sp.]